MKMPSRFFPLFFWPASLQTIISSSLIVSCHGEHVDVKVFILSLSSLRILLLMIFHTLRANRSMERGPSGWRTSNESGKGVAELDRRRNPSLFSFSFSTLPPVYFYFLGHGAWRTYYRKVFPVGTQFGASLAFPDWSSSGHSLVYPASRRKKYCQNFHPPHSQKWYQIGFWSNQ